MAAAGYSRTPLAKKLGIKEGFVVATIHEPDNFRELLDPVPADVLMGADLGDRAEIVILFCLERRVLESNIERASRAIFPNGAIWVAWPKKASKVPTDMTEDVVREVVLPLGLVDVKVAAIDDVWSGLRVVWRKEKRV